MNLKVFDGKSNRIIEIKTKPEYGQLVPPLIPIEYENLKQSIKESNGNTIPLLLNEEGIIDDRHRFKACQEIAITPKIETKEFADNLEEKEFIISINRNRRHLNHFQISELSYKLEEIQRRKARIRLSEANKFRSEINWKAEKKIMVDEDIKSIHTKLLILAQTFANIEEENKTTQRAIALLKQTLIEFLSFKKDNLVRKREQRF